MTKKAKAPRNILRDILGYPLTWAPFLVPMSLFAFTGTPGWINALLFAGTGAAVGAGWLSQLSRIQKLQEAEKLQYETHRIQENRSNFVASLRRNKFEEYADIVEKAVEIEQRIAIKMKQDGSLVFTEIEQTANSLCEEIISQVYKVLELTEEFHKALKDRKIRLKQELAEREELLHRALETLEKTEENIGSYKGDGPKMTSKARLTHLIDKMEEEEQIIGRVRQRMDDPDSGIIPLSQEELENE
tara:strand:- start:262 stop:996 length:735 start_codon:yes stop_codon:yes gene_type:complete